LAVFPVDLSLAIPSFPRHPAVMTGRKSVAYAMNSSPTTWEVVLGRVESKVNRHSFYTWFKRTTQVADEGTSLLIQVTDELVREWLEKHYAGVLAEALTDVGRPGTALQFITETEVQASLAREAPPSPAPASAPAVMLSASSEPSAESMAIGLAGLNPRYTFDTFVVGSSNQFAHAACRAVAEAPARSYNPLFIYGGVGLGKTHMMHAIGHYVLGQAPSTRLTYVSGERFMNEMINALRYDRILEFRERYRTIDLLLVDDVQFIAGKEATQTEFFHTFNALHPIKQIVITSDCPPHEIPQLEERLRSRFEWGLIADIQPPDLETKVAILKKKAEAEGVPLPDNVAIYIAGKIKSNIRELEGSLTRLVAFASLHAVDITLSLTQDVLKNVLNAEEKAVSVEIIQKFVADYYRLKVSDIKSRNNAKSVSMPRQVAMYLCKQLTNASLPEIGRSFGGKHHSTVIHSIRKIEDLRKREADFNSLINNLLDNFR
jgi:chromosomal replication initiator protein